ncbi:hypothetical protein [Alkaliphilus transvaalensis]|uniref:hypothetical protein n=1 Tax=Alkaliphilus transvaalensis TaxID=114628 RepID=UPI000479EC7C|nr:hypothetical protein [Alkaliphilus transvaalensis]
MNFRKMLSLMIVGLFIISQSVLASTEVLTHESMVTNGQSKIVEIAPLWLNINSITTSLSISNTGVASSSAIISGAKGTTSISAIYSLEKKSGNTWSTVRTWTDSTSATRLTFAESSNVAGGTYRLSVTATVVRNGVSETVTVISTERTH